MCIRDSRHAFALVWQIILHCFTGIFQTSDESPAAIRQLAVFIPVSYTHLDVYKRQVDMAIFIDRIADMRVNQMNLILEATRQTILKEHAPGENDLYMRCLLYTSRCV